MKKTISILVLSALPALALAGGDDDAGGGHESGHHEHSSHHSSSMAHDKHEGDSGRPGELSAISRTVEVTMADTMRFSPDMLEFKAGETVRFVVRNLGKIRHEMVIGSLDELKTHAEMMRADPAMQHADSNMVTLAPGEQGDIVWQFDKPGTFDFACLVPGHLEAGMTGRIEID